MPGDYDFFDYKFFAFVLIGLLYFFLRRSAGFYEVSKGFFEILVCLIIVLAGASAVWISRYYMPHVCVNGFSGSILGSPVVKMDINGRKWLIFNTGEYLDPFHGRGKLATLVVPFDMMRKVGNSWVGIVSVSKKPLRLLRPVVFSFLSRNSGDYNLEVIYSGRFDETQKLEAVVFSGEKKSAFDIISDLELENESLNGALNIRGTIIEGNNDILIEMKKSSDELQGKKSLFDVFRRKESADNNSG
jgi:hypothetical protein